MNLNLDWGKIATVLAGIAILVTVYQVVESSEAELRSEMQRVESDLKSEMQKLEAGLRAEMQESEARLRAEMQESEARLRAEMRESEARLRAQMQSIEFERKADMAALIDRFDRFVERVDSRLDEVEREQTRLSAVNDLLAEQLGR